MPNEPAARREPVVMAAQFSVAETENEITRLFERVVHNGWLPRAASTLVVRLDAEWSEIARRVADAIVAFCAGLGYAQVLLWTKDKALTFGQVIGPASASVLAVPDFRLLSACMPHGVPAQMLWLAPFDLVTVTTPRPDRQCGLSAILAAQARMLADDRAWCLELIAEAHRLIRSDVAVVCGSLSSGGSARAFCALSNDDVALEIAVGRAAGVHPLRLPHLRFLSTQYVFSFDSKVIGEMPILNRLITPRWRILLPHAFWRLVRYCDQVKTDLGLARANLARIPDFLVRRGILKRAIP